MNSTALIGELTRLARAAGDPALELVIAGEGNASARSAGGDLLVSASGSRLADADADTWVEVSAERILDDLDTAAGDDDWLRAVERSRIDPGSPRPTVEVALHAVLASEAGADFVLHTHPTAVLALLCSGHGELLARRRYFPDHIVMLGEEDCLIPYIDPGLELAREVRRRIRDWIAQHGEPPRTVLVEHHGVFALGRSRHEALERTLMLVKVARLMIPTLRDGGPIPLTDGQVARIAGREDEAYRRTALA